MPIIHTIQTALAGINIILGLYHLYLLFRMRDKYVHVFSLIMCAGAALYIGSNFSLYHIEQTDSYAGLIMIQAYGMGLFHLGLAGHIAALSGIGKKIMVIFGTILAGFITVMQISPSLLDPGSMVYPGARLISPWGEEIHLIHPGMSSFAHAYQAFIASAYIICLYAAVRLYRHGEKKKAGTIFSGLAVIFISLFMDALIFNMNLPLPFMSDFGFTFMTVLLSLITSQGFIDAAILSEKLKKSEEMYRILMETGPDPIVMMNLQGMILSANRRTAELYGVDSPAQFIEEVKNVLELLPEEDRENAVRYMVDMITNQSRGKHEYRIRLKNGSYINTEIHSSLVTDFAGRPSAYVSIIRDITDRIKIEDEVRENEEYRRILFEESLIPMIVMDPNTMKFTDCNDAAVRIYGYSSKEQVIGKTPADVSAPYQYDGCESAAAVAQHVAETRMTGYDFFLWAHQRENGERWDAEVHLMRFTIRGKPMLQFSLQDITKRKLIESDRERALAALSESENRTRMTAEKLGILFYDYNVYSGSIVWSGAIEKLTGFSVEEFNAVDIGRWEAMIHPEDRKRSTDELEKAQSRLDDYNIEYRFAKKNGSYIYVQDHGAFIPGPDGKPARMLGFMSDISDRIAAQIESEKTHSQLIQAQKMEAIGTLASGLAHDFNNMLAGIIGGLSMLKILLDRENLVQKETLDGYIKTAQTSAERAAAMIRQLLTISRKQDISMVPVDLNTSVEHLRIICANSFPKSVSLDFNVLAEPARVLADPTQVEQLLLNLCVNASHAMTIMRPTGQKEGGTLTLKVDEMSCDQVLAETNPGLKVGVDYIKITVSDTGIGMDKATVKRIFEPFFTTKKKEEGTGLGLSVAYGIVQQHGGVIHVYSEKGIGTTFSVYLPRLSAAETSGDEKTVESRLVSGQGRVLIIDDEEAVINVARGILTSCGYEVFHEMVGQKAVEFFTEHAKEIDAVLLDMSMPGLSGLEIFERLISLKPEVRVLLSSGFAEDERIKKARKMGVRGFIQKPYTAGDLAAAIKKIIE